MVEGKFNENTRVQVPAALHLVRLGYTYLAGIKDDEYNADTNILTKVFIRSIRRINPDISEADAQTLLADIVRILGNDDLGREFYGKLSSISGVKLVDFENPANNEWHVTTEFTCEDKETGDNFRPDITCFLNGLPLAFIEVKKPNNAEGIMAEKDRINDRMIEALRTRFDGKFAEIGSSVSIASGHADDLRETQLSFTGLTAEGAATENVPMLSGRSFSEEDVIGKRRVAIVPENFLKVYYKLDLLLFHRGFLY